MDEKAATQRVILVAVDHSDPSEMAVSFVADLLRANPGAELHAVHTVSPAYRTSHEDIWARDLPGKIDDGRVIADLPPFYAAVLRRLGPEVVGHLRYGRADREIVLLAGEISADLIVMGTTGRTRLERFFRDSVAERVLRAAPCAVCVLRTKKETANQSLPGSYPTNRRFEKDDAVV
jgi:nucleotide-binding universal stress UspA family protein